MRRRKSESAAEGPGVDDILELDDSIRALAFRMHADISSLRNYGQPEDLVQEIYLKAMLKLEKFRGDSSLKTWVIEVAKNHLLSRSRFAKTRAAVSLPGDDGPLGSRLPPRSFLGQRSENHNLRSRLRESTTGLLSWLRHNPDAVEDGWEVLNLLLWNHGDYEKVALSMSLHTGRGWTVEKVRWVVRQIKKTPRGGALCGDLGIRSKGHKSSKKGAASHG